MAPQALIDSHCHLQFAVYDPDREAVIARSREAGVSMVNIGTEFQTSVDAVSLAHTHPDVMWATVGFHPNHVDADAYHDPMEHHEPRHEQFNYGQFLNLAADPTVVAIGECGLDYYRIQDLESSIQERQRDVFERQIKLAYEIRKPLVVHCREAFGDLIRILDSRFQILNSPAGVVHFFSGSWEDAQKLLDLGFYLSFGGVITFTRDYDEVVKRVPFDRLLVETDAPYVAPVPYRGKRNEPAYIVAAAKKIVELRGISYDEVARATTANTRQLLSL